MKLKKKIIAFMALISLGTFFCGAKGSANIVQAKTNTTFFPKKCVERGISITIKRFQR